jgi:hypothetical protein
MAKKTPTKTQGKDQEAAPGKKERVPGPDKLKDDDHGKDKNDRDWKVEKVQIEGQPMSAHVEGDGANQGLYNVTRLLPCGSYHYGSGCVSAARAELKRHVERECPCFADPAI